MIDHRILNVIDGTKFPRLTGLLQFLRYICLIIALLHWHKSTSLLQILHNLHWSTDGALGPGIFLPEPAVSGVRSMGPGVPPYIQHLFETLLMWLWLMMIPTQYWLMKPIGQFGIDGGQWSLRWWWSSKLVWRCLMWAMRSLGGSVRWCKSCRECWTLVQCDYVGDNIGCWAIG